MSDLAWGATVAVVVLLLSFDLVLLGRRKHAVRSREAIVWSLLYIAIALLFGLVFGLLAGWGLGTQYFAAYVVEKSLSVDNLFVFVVIVGTFSVPAAQQPKALTIGIVIALVLRFALILLGATLIDAFSFMFLIFGVALLGTAFQLFRHRDQDPTIEDNVIVSLARRLLPVSSDYEEGQMWTRVRGRFTLTPMFLVVIAIGSTDILFALDSIPAAFGVTQHAYVVFAANAFALLGLRALFFLVSGLLDRLVYLSTGLSLLLAFIGVKLVLHFAHTQSDAVPDISTAASLVVIAVILITVTIASLIQARRHEELRAHAGSLRASGDDGGSTSPREG